MQKIIQQLKFLRSQDQKDVKQQIVSVLNRIFPFSQYPIQTPPPMELTEVITKPQITICTDLKKQLDSFSFIILRGSLIISRDIYAFTEEKYLDKENIGEKAMYDINQGMSTMIAKFDTVFIKIHNIWIKKAKKRTEQMQREYIRKKLLNIDFFAHLQFTQFNDCCRKAFLRTIGPQQILLEQGKTPCNMYVVIQGQLCLNKIVKFSKQQSVWSQVKSQLKKDNEYCQELFQYLVRQPAKNSSCFQVNFILKKIHAGQIICAKQTLLESPLQFTIKSPLKTKLICIRYVDFYVINQDRLLTIREWQSLCEINLIQLRKYFYKQANWNDYKNFLKKQNGLTKVQQKSFVDLLRKQVDFTQGRFQFSLGKVGKGQFLQNPASKVLKLNGFLAQNNSQKKL